MFLCKIFTSPGSSGTVASFLYAGGCRKGRQSRWMARSPTLDLCPRPLNLWHLSAFPAFSPSSLSPVFSRQRNFIMVEGEGGLWFLKKLGFFILRSSCGNDLTVSPQTGCDKKNLPFLRHSYALDGATCICAPVKSYELSGFAFFKKNLIYLFCLENRSVGDDITV